MMQLKTSDTGKLVALGESLLKEASECSFENIWDQHIKGRDLNMMLTRLNAASNRIAVIDSDAHAATIAEQLLTRGEALLAASRFFDDVRKKPASLFLSIFSDERQCVCSQLPTSLLVKVTTSAASSLIKQVKPNEYAKLDSAVAFISGKVVKDVWTCGMLPCDKPSPQSLGPRLHVQNTTVANLVEHMFNTFNANEFCRTMEHLLAGKIFPVSVERNTFVAGNKFTETDLKRWGPQVLADFSLATIFLPAASAQPDQCHQPGQPFGHHRRESHGAETRTQFTFEGIQRNEKARWQYCSHSMGNRRLDGPRRPQHQRCAKTIHGGVARQIGRQNFARRY